MTPGISDNELQNYLEKISKPDLAAWLMERCREDEKLRASLLDLVIPKENAEALAGEIRTRLHQARELAKHRDGWHMAQPISRELGHVLTSIQALMEKGGLTEAEKLLADFVRIAPKGMEQVDDSYGYLSLVCQEGVTLWGEVWTRIEPRDTAQLANLVYEQIHDDGYVVKDDMIPEFAKALGEDGLHTLQARLKGDLAALPRHDPQGGHLYNLERRHAVRWLKEIADALGDVDEYIAIVESEQQVQIEALPIARRLFEAGRLQEALAFLEPADANQRLVQDEPYDYPTLKTKILIALGRQDEAREILWQTFASCPSRSMFEKILELTPEEKKPETHNRAISLAEHHRWPAQGAQFLVQVNELERAARLVQQKKDEISGSWYDVLLKVAEALAEPYPSQAWTLYEIMLLDILNEARCKAYAHAADYLIRMEQLAEKAGIQSQQTEFTQNLRRAHGRKSSFWAKLKNLWEAHFPQATESTPPDRNP